MLALLSLKIASRSAGSIKIVAALKSSACYPTRNEHSNYTTTKLSIVFEVVPRCKCQLPTECFTILEPSKVSELHKICGST